MDRARNGAAGQRSLARRVQGRQARPLLLHGHRLGGPLPHLAARFRAPRRAGRHPDRAAVRRPGRARGSGSGLRRGRATARTTGAGAGGAAGTGAAPRTRHFQGTCTGRIRLPRPQPCRGTRPRARDRGRSGRWPATAPGTSCSRAPHRRIPVATAPSGTVSRSFRRSRRWASTCSTCRPSIRSAGSSARDRTTRSRPGPDDPGSPWAIGASEGGHLAIHPAARHARPTSGRWSRPRASAGSRSRSTSPSSARPIIPTSPSIRSGSSGALTAPSSTPRTRPRNTRTSTRSTSRIRTGRASSKSSSRSSCTGSPRA